MPLANPTLSILVGPTIERSLLDVLFAPAPPCQLEVGRIASDLETATSDLMAADRAAKAARRDPAGRCPRPRSSTPASAQTVSLLVAAQNDDGGWGWTGSGVAAAIAMPRRGPSGH